MPKMQIVTDEMFNIAKRIGQNTRDILEYQNNVSKIFRNMGRTFTGNVPSLMVQHMLAMESEYMTMNEMLNGYKNFIEDSARNYDWTEDEMTRWAEALRKR